MRKSSISKKGTIIFFSALLIAGLIIPSRFAVTLTQSLNDRVFFLIKPRPSDIKKGNYVLFDLNDERIKGAKTKSVIKQVGCDEGDMLTSKNKEYYCNEYEYLGKAKDISLQGKELDHFDYNGTVPEGYVYVVSRHKDSFDSRYFGFIEKSGIAAIAKPVF